MWVRRKREEKYQCLHSSVQLHSELVCVFVVIVNLLFGQQICQSSCIPVLNASAV